MLNYQGKWHMPFVQQSKKNCICIAECSRAPGSCQYAFLNSRRSTNLVNAHLKFQLKYAHIPHTRFLPQCCCNIGNKDRNNYSSPLL
jgi:hypothetical protein